MSKTRSGQKSKQPAKTAAAASRASTKSDTKSKKTGTIEKQKTAVKAAPTSKKTSVDAAKAAKKPTEKPIKTAAPTTKSTTVKIATKSKAKSVPALASADKKSSSSAKRGKSVSVGGSKKSSAPIVLDPNYRPSEDEPFMNERQRAYFRNKLKTWKEDIVRQTRETLAGLHEDSTQHADLADRATSETDRALELRARDRQRKLIAKIDAAIARIDDGSYGYCEETGEPIGLKRLDARPIATLSLEAQERHERRERVYRED